MKTLRVDRKFTKALRTPTHIEFFARDYQIEQDDQGSIHETLLHENTCDTVPIISCNVLQTVNGVTIPMTIECIDDLLVIVNKLIEGNNTVYTPMEIK